MKPLAIVGIDPGITAAFAALDIRGQIIAVHSQKQFSPSEMIKQLVDVCHPVVIGTDKGKLPFHVSVIARRFGATLIIPPQDLKQEEKRLMVAGYPRSNDHERDALASACYAWRKLLPKLEKLVRYLKEHPVDDQREFIKTALQEDLHFEGIENALSVKKGATPPKPQVKNCHSSLPQQDSFRLKEKLKAQDDRLLQQAFQMRELREYLRRTRAENEKLRRASTFFDQKISKLFSFKEQRLKQQEKVLLQKEAEIVRLQKQIQQLYLFQGKSTGFQVIKIIPTLGYADYQARQGFLLIQPNDLVWVDRPEQFSQQLLELFQGKGILLLSARHFPEPVQKILLAKTIDRQMIQENAFFGLMQKSTIEKIRDSFPLAERVVKEYRESRKRDT